MREFNTIGEEPNEVKAYRILFDFPMKEYVETCDKRLVEE